MQRVGICGEKPSEYVLSRLRVERSGYFSVLSYAVDGLKHWMEVVVRQDKEKRPHQAAVVLLPYDPVNREVYLLNAPRHNRFWVRTVEGLEALARSLLTDEESPDVHVVPAGILDNWDTAAGMVEHGESAIEAAIREGEEELGFTVKRERLTHVASLNGSIGALAENLELFMYELDGRLDALKPKGDGDEQHDIWRVSYAEAFEMLDQDKFQGAGGHALIQRLRIMDLEKRLADSREEVRRVWERRFIEE